MVNIGAVGTFVVRENVGESVLRESISVQLAKNFGVKCEIMIVPAKAIVNLRSGDGMDNFEVSPDGQRFLIHQQSGGSKAPQIHVVLNWTEELRRLAPANKQP